MVRLQRDIRVTNVSTNSTNNVETTIVLLRDTAEHFTVPQGKNVILDLQNYTLSNFGSSPIIENDDNSIETTGTEVIDSTTYNTFYYTLGT